MDHENLSEKVGKNIWAEAMADEPEFGQEISAKQVEEIYHGKEVYGADKGEFFTDEEKVAKLRAAMAGWGNVSVFRGILVGDEAANMNVTPAELIEKRTGIVNEMADYIIDAYGINKKPAIEVDNLGLLDGGYNGEENMVVVDAGMVRGASSANKILRFLAHELMHCYDEQEVAENGSALGAMIKYNAEHYIKDGVDNYEDYAGQLNERRAFAREELVMKQFEELQADRQKS